MAGPLENPNIKKFYQQAPKPFNYVPNDLVNGNPTIPPIMSGLMRIDPNSGNIWISAGNTLVSDWKLITGGGGGAVTSIIQGSGISISSTGPGGTGDVTVSSSLTPQGLQDVIIEDNVLTQNNTIFGTNTSIEWKSNDYFYINPAASYSGGYGYFKAAVGKYPPSYSELYVEAIYAQMKSEGASHQVVKVDTTGVYVQTPAVYNASASVGQVLTLTNATTGQVEFQSMGVPILITTGQDIIVNGGTTLLTNFTIPVVSGKSYSFKATILYYVPDTTVEVSWGMQSSTSFNGNKGMATWSSSSAVSTKVFDLSSVSSSSVDSILGDNIAVIEGVLHTASATDFVDLIIGLSTPGPAPATPVSILPGSTFIYYEV